MAITGATDLGNGQMCVTVSHDPTSVATNVPAGTLIIDANGVMYRKRDAGSTTNVQSLTVRAGSTKITVADNASQKTVDIDVDPAVLAPILLAARAYAASEGQSDTDLITYQTKLTFAFVPDYTGNYIAIWSSEFTNSSNNKQVSMLVDIDNTTIINEVVYQPPASIVWINQSGFAQESLTQGITYNFKIKWRCISAGVNTASIRRARLMIIRSTA
mgnify:CR=1 FL=1